MAGHIQARGGAEADDKGDETQYTKRLDHLKRSPRQDCLTPPLIAPKVEGFVVGQG